MSFPIFDVLTANATDLQRDLATGALSSVTIVEQYLEQIHKHNQAGLELHALISVAPKHSVLARARALDVERVAGHLRGPLHGLPIIVKDVIITDAEMGMDTTAGAYAFVGAVARKNSEVAQQLLDSGLIILGKANLTEFCGLKARRTTPGWSACGGQTQTAYVKERYSVESDMMTAPGSGGSSSGSAVGVSAGFAPLSLATETGGSCAWPASRAALYALRPTVGNVSMNGVCGISKTFDGVGAMAKSSHDLALLCEAILTPAARENIPQADFISAMSGTWENISIGFLDFDTTEQVKPDYEDAISKMRELGCKVAYPVEAPSPDTLVIEGQSGLHMVATSEFAMVVANFAAGFESSRVRTLDDIISFNEENADLAMPEPHPDQEDLLEARNDTTTPEEAEAARAKLGRLAGPDGMDKVMEKYGVDIIAAPSGSRLCVFAACAGYPLATVPLGISPTGAPYGLFLLTMANRENKLFQFMSAFEASFSKRVPPPPLDVRTAFHQNSC